MNHLSAPLKPYVLFENPHQADGMAMIAFNPLLFPVPGVSTVELQIASG